MSLAHDHHNCIEQISDMIVMDLISCGDDIYIKSQASEIREFKSKMTDAFSKQRIEVLGNMPAKGYVKAAGDEWLFDAEAWTETMAAIGTPYIVEAIETAGAAAIVEVAPEMVFNARSEAMQEFVRKHPFKFSFNVNEETIKQLRIQFADGIANGEGIVELRKRVENVFDIAEKFRSERIARSEIVRASNAAAEEAYIQSGVVEGKEWVANPGACPWCNEIHGTTMRLGGSFFDLGDSLTVDGATLHFDYDFIKYPPAHPNCLCSLIPIVRGRSFRPGIIRHPATYNERRLKVA